jgi:hypothetical protein
MPNSTDSEPNGLIAPNVRVDQKGKMMIKS